MKVAFIGLGNMGAAIAQRILNAGHSLTVWNRTASKCEPLIALGARGAASAKDAVGDAEVVVTSLMDDQSVLDIVRAPDGIIAGMRAGATHLCLMTISPWCADELQAIHEAHGTHYVSGPVVGRPEAAATGQLVTYLAGSQKATSALLSLCEAYATKAMVLSQRANVANCMKLVINFNVVSAIEMISETYVLAEKCGIPLEFLRDFYQQLWFAHPAAKMYAEKLRARDFAGRGGFVMKGGLKDVRLMLATAKNVEAALEIGSIIERKLAAGVESGMAETDWSAIYEISRREAGLD